MDKVKKLAKIAVFETKVVLTPKDLGKDITNIKDILEDKIKTQYEGRCSRNGYILPRSVKMLSRSMGMVEKGRFSGDILYYSEVECSVLYPPDGVVLDALVVRKNKMGVYASFEDAIRVMVPRDLHIGDEAFDAIEVGQTIQVEIKKSRFQVNDTSILSVGVFRGVSAVPLAPVAVAKEKTKGKTGKGKTGKGKSKAKRGGGENESSEEEEEEEEENESSDEEDEDEEEEEDKEEEKESAET
jgi:DNA-directed RNA polymerase subunit E'/Rpb7